MNAPAPINVQAVKAATRIEQVASTYGIKLMRQGRELVGLSPFKRERTPSFFIHPQKQVFKCFATGEGGDVIKFVQLMDGIGFADALKRLAAGAGIQGDEHAAALAEKRRQLEAKFAEDNAREKKRRISLAYEIWQKTKPAQGTLAEIYLRARGIDLDAIRQGLRIFDTGFAAVPPATQLSFIAGSASRACAHWRDLGYRAPLHGRASHLDRSERPRQSGCPKAEADARPGLGFSRISLAIKSGRVHRRGL